MNYQHAGLPFIVLSNETQQFHHLWRIYQDEAVLSDCFLKTVDGLFQVSLE